MSDDSYFVFSFFSPKQIRTHIGVEAKGGRGGREGGGRTGEASEEECAFLSVFLCLLLVSSSLPCFFVLFLFSSLFCYYPTHTHHGETSEPQTAGGNVPCASSEVVLWLGGVSAQCACFGGNGGKGTVCRRQTDVKGKCRVDLLFDSL